MTQLSKPLLQFPTQRSAMPFCHGLRKLLRFGWRPKLFAVLMTSSLKFGSTVEDQIAAKEPDSQNREKPQQTEHRASLAWRLATQSTQFILI
jgi:hypothetical protein